MKSVKGTRRMDMDKLKQETSKYKTAFEEASKTAQFAANHGDFTYFQIGKDLFFGTSSFREIFEDVYSGYTLVRLDILESRTCCEGDEELRFPKISDYYNHNEWDFPDATQENEPFFVKPENIWMLFIILSNSYKNQIYKHKPNDPLSVLVQQLLPIYQNQELSPKEKFNEIQVVKNRFCTIGNQQKTILGEKTEVDIHSELEYAEEKSVSPNRNPENDFFQKADSWSQIGFMVSTIGVTIKIGKSKKQLSVQELKQIIPKKKPRDFLLHLIQAGAIFDKDKIEGPARNNLKAYVSSLRSTIKIIFAIDAEPIKSLGGGSYQAMFSVSSEFHSPPTDEGPNNDNNTPQEVKRRIESNPPKDHLN
jgi:hypothetical protein